MVQPEIPRFALQPGPQQPLGRSPLLHRCQVVRQDYHGGWRKILEGRLLRELLQPGAVPPPDRRQQARPQGIRRQGQLVHFLHSPSLFLVLGDARPVRQRRQQGLPQPAVPHPRRGGFRRGYIHPVVLQRLRIQGGGPGGNEVPFFDRGLPQPKVVQFAQQVAIGEGRLQRHSNLPHPVGQFLGRRARRQQLLGLLQGRQRQPRRRQPPFRVVDLLIPFGQERLGLSQGRRHRSLRLGQPSLVR